MADTDVLAQWLASRSFYAGLVLALLVIGLLLALLRRRNTRGGQAPRPPPGKSRRKRGK